MAPVCPTATDGSAFAAAYETAVAVNREEGTFGWALVDVSRGETAQAVSAVPYSMKLAVWSAADQLGHSSTPRSRSRLSFLGGRRCSHTALVLPDAHGFPRLSFVVNTEPGNGTR
jgi:hypothetical protein